MDGKLRGTDMVVIGLLIYIAWKEFNPSGLSGGCLPSSIPGAPGPNSSMIGPAWMLNPQQQTSGGLSGYSPIAGYND